MMKKIIFLILIFPYFAFATANTVVYDITDNKVIDGYLDNSHASIASISKLMTIYTILKEQQDLQEKLTVTGKKVTNTHIHKGMVLTRLDLIKLALVSSDNLAAQTLCENFTSGNQNCIHMMNENALQLGMYHTGFVEPTGLSPMNYSSISDIVILTQAVSKYDIVQSAAQMQKVVTETTTTVKKGKKQIISKVQGNPTSRYFGHDGIITIKTGFTNAAGFCITMLVVSHDKLYNITVLGARTSRERQQIVERSLSTVFNA